MVSWLNLAAQFWNQWSVRGVVLSSFAANGVLVVMAGTRRRQASGFRTLLLWLAYQLTDLAATYALGNLSLSRSSASLREHQLVAFWAPFLLLHLGGPDNISGYALEDNKLSMRQGLHVVMQVTAAWYVLYKHIYLVHSSGVLLPASSIMLAVGVARYVERVCALWRGDLGHIRGSSKEQRPVGPGCSFAELVCFRGERNLDNEQALVFAHDMFHVCNRAMVDSSVDMDSPNNGSSSSDKIFSLQWSSMSKVVEMELSLMYDILYTKATVIHTCGGYLIRFISSSATVIVTSLFWIYPKEGQRRADVIITYILLPAAFVLETTWLVRAVGSTWTSAFLKSTPWAWLQHELLCSGRWRQLRRVMLSLDPRRLLGKEPSSYRLWSFTIGRYNLLHECTRSRGTAGLCGTFASMAGLDDIWNEYQHSRCLFELTKDVKELLFTRIQRRLPSSYSSVHGDAYSMVDITTSWGHIAVRRRPKALGDLNLNFGREFQEDILVWHIGTCIFLSCADQQLIRGTHFKPAIEALSEYLMFLVAVRRHMLPGLALRSLFEVTHQALGEVCQKNGLSVTTRKEKLAEILRQEKYKDPDWGLDSAKNRLMSDGAELAIALLMVPSSLMPELLDLIFNVWVDKLLYASTRCSRESHAKQLSRGGELTTIVWIMAEHAVPFRIGETYEQSRDKTGEEKKKKKEEEEKKKKEEEEKKKKIRRDWVRISYGACLTSPDPAGARGTSNGPTRHKTN